MSRLLGVRVFGARIRAWVAACGALWTAAALAPVGGCATEMTVAAFTNQQLLVKGDPAFKKMVDAAGKAEIAFNFTADTPIKDVKRKRAVREKLRDMLNNSRDAYRQAASYGAEQRPSTLVARDVRLIDWREPDAGRVPIPGSGCFWRVVATPRQVLVQSIESSRKVPIITFDSWLKPTLSPKFRPYLEGDQIDVDGDLDVELGRGEGTQRYEEEDDARPSEKARRRSRDDDNAADDSRAPKRRPANDDDADTRKARRAAREDEDAQPAPRKRRESQPDEQDDAPPSPKRRATPPPDDDAPPLPKRRAAATADDDAPPPPKRKPAKKTSSVEDELQ